MNNLTKIGIGAGIVGIAIIGTPVIYNSQINKFIEQEKSELQKKNIEVKETKNNDTFLSANREYILTIKNSAPLIEKIYPQIDPWSLRDLTEVFDNTQFLVQLNFTKLPVYHKDAVKIDLYSLNDSLTKELSKDEVGKKILELIKNRAFEVIFDIDNLEVSKVKLKDIDLNLNKITANRANKLKFEIKGMEANLNEHISAFALKKIALNYEIEDKAVDYNEKDNFSLNNLNLKVKEQDNFNNSSDLKIDGINFSVNSSITHNEFKFHNISYENSVKTIAGKTSLNTKIAIDNFKIKLDDTLIKVNNLKYNFFVLNLDTPSLKKIIEAENDPNKFDTEELMHNFENLIQKGVQMSFSPLSVDKIEINSFNQKFEIAPLTIEAESRLPQNDYTLQKPMDYLLNKIDTTIKITTEKENIEKLNEFDPEIALYLKNFEKEVNGKVIINFEYKQGKIISNKKSVQ